MPLKLVVDAPATDGTQQLVLLRGDGGQYWFGEPLPPSFHLCDRSGTPYCLYRNEVVSKLLLGVTASTGPETEGTMLFWLYRGTSLCLGTVVSVEEIQDRECDPRCPELPL